MMAKLSHPNDKIIAALVAAGFIDDPKMIQRVLIDIQYGDSPKVYVQRFTNASGDDVANVIAALADSFGPENMITSEKS
jgi:hypothetical protein